ncbi:MAG: DUF2283 domain-containing protein [Candidatus Thorarchaeota archaeon]
MTQIVIDLSEIDVQYDSENDVIYVSFGIPQEADDSEMLPNGIVVRYKDGNPIGFTVVGAKRVDKERVQTNKVCTNSPQE